MIEKKTDALRRSEAPRLWHDLQQDSAAKAMQTERIAREVAEKTKRAARKMKEKKTGQVNKKAVLDAEKKGWDDRKKFDKERRDAVLLTAGISKEKWDAFMKSKNWVPDFEEKLEFSPKSNNAMNR